jgi:hypothetical protein
LIFPSVVSASKSGATAPIWSAMLRPHVVQVAGEIRCGNIGAGGGIRNGSPKRINSFSNTVKLLESCSPYWPCGEKAAMRPKFQ